jgi:hypothetical protein
MDDFIISNLNEARNEWSVRIVNIFTPLIIEGLKSIFDKSWEICYNNNECDKYLMTFQNLLVSVPKWNSLIIEKEKKRIIERSGCNYLTDLITCVHIIQLKILTCIRVGNKQKKIDISIPNLDTFIHKIYVNTARKVYSNVYLFEKKIPPLQVQKNNRELENIIQECILYTIRESIPTEQIVRAYLDESEEIEEEVIIENIQDINEEVKKEETSQNTDNKEQDKNDNKTDEFVPSISNLNDDNVITKISFNDFDTILDEKKQKVEAPKNIERLEEISTSRALQRRLEEEDNDDDNYEQSRINITDDLVDIGELDIFDVDKPVPTNIKENPTEEDINLDFDDI